MLGADVVHTAEMAGLLLAAVAANLAAGGVALIVLEAAAHRFGIAEFQALLAADPRWSAKITAAPDALVAGAPSGHAFEIYEIRRGSPAPGGNDSS